LENKRAEPVLPRGVGGKGSTGEQGGEMTKTMYTHMNKYKNNKKRKTHLSPEGYLRKTKYC
jgi:hypothetical protein